MSVRVEWVDPNEVDMNSTKTPPIAGACHASTASTCGTAAYSMTDKGEK